VLDAGAETAIDHARLSDTCAPLRLLPPGDYDGDGSLDAVVYSEERIAAFSVDPRAGALRALGDWSCPAPTAP
jgi:hypothetical protein